MSNKPPEREDRPAFLFYAKDFLASGASAVLSPDAGWGYLHLLSHAWLQRGLPMDPKQLAGMARMTPAKFKKEWAGALGTYFEERGGRYVNPRQEEYRAGLDETRKTKQAAANKRWGSSDREAGY